MAMPAKGPVSVLWQIIFVVFIPFLDLWAFYRIKKLKKYLLYVYVPQIIIGGIIAGLFLSMAFDVNSLEKVENISEDLENNELALIILNILMGLGFTVFSIYLIATWSEKWNKHFLDS
jgi:NO-binding membrane sensor protein with MHYT domain